MIKEYFTEQEANDKLCPLVARDSAYKVCVAGGCMMWIWENRRFMKSDRGYCGLVRREP